MMKFIYFLIFMIPLCFMKNKFWLVQMMMFLLMFLLMLMNLNIYYFSNLSFMFGIDIISYSLVLLSVWICILMMMASENLFKKKKYFNLFMLNILLLLLLLLLTFMSMNLFMFYLFFESSLIPTLMLIIGWGYQVERIQASMYLLFYTLFASLPLLLGIFFMYEEINSMIIYLMKFYNFNLFILYFVMIFAFLVKMPMYFFHLWLPKAHVEASVSGSMILAGIMLKLGGYGMLRVMIMLQEVNLKFNYIYISISLIGGFLVSIICFCQIDMKSLIAYSSVAHMSFVLGGIFTMNYWGFMGSLILMLGHGLCSSGMFCLVNINYERIGSRSLFINKGMMNFMPSMSMMWFMLSSSNMAAPPSMNLLGEISLINSMISWSWMTMILLMLVSFFSAGYSLYLYSYIQHGMFHSGIYSCYMGVSREYLLLMLHWLPLNLFVLKIDLMYLFI
uniref:NADH-ubiquinone oxidoreductase chain 4 n=1 Tax=Thitarodes damxungensis TaxID=92018 RepID=A0A5C0F4J6_9NEOP|nr:NADH dehydrogenase subunit 4 [Thitarodes damxungensis]QEI59718.1 NADH dehydrogenase subunit 4 [Thitarodes damxungensis]